MKVVWHSNVPWAPTGYGQQTAEVTRRIRDDGHHVAISSFWGLGGNPQFWEDMIVFPSDERSGNTYLPGVANHFGAGDPVLVITLMDVWVIVPNPHIAELNLAAWVPIDHEPIPPNVANFFEWSDARPIAMSRFGERELQKKGLDALYVPHCVDTSQFRPKPEARTEARAILDIPEDAFVVGMVAANKGSHPPRKAFPQVFEAFARFLDQHGDAYLYMHAEMTGKWDGIDLRRMAEAVDLPLDRLRYTPPWSLEMGASQDHMASVFSMFDVLANPSFGEGFGIPIIEAQACGVPVIVTDFTAMTELCGAGWLVDGDRWWHESQASWWKAPGVGNLVHAFEQAYEAREDVALRERAREFALTYDAARVFDEHWRPVLAELTPDDVPAEVVEPEVFVREPNRAERRAVAKKAA